MVIGIDPGFTGAISFVVSKDVMQVFDLPLKLFMGRKQIDGTAFAKLIKDRQHLIRFAIIEDVHAMPNQGVTSTFRFGYNAGILLGVLNALNVKVLKVKPSVWKCALNLSSDKKKSLQLAKKKFPAYKELFKRAKDDGRAEAALLALYAFETFC